MVFPGHLDTQGPRGARLTADVHGSELKMSDAVHAVRSHAKCVYWPPGMSRTPIGTSHIEITTEKKGGEGNNSRKGWLTTKKVVLVVVSW